MTSVGRCMRSITEAIVIVLPVPVAPSSVVIGTPSPSASTIPSIALG